MVAPRSDGACLIAGCGDLGGAVAARLLASGRTRVFGLRRSVDAPLPEGVERVTADLAELDGLPDGVVDIVCAVAPGSGGRTPEGYRQTYRASVEGIVAAAAARPGRRRFIFVSSTSVHGVDDGRTVDGGEVDPAPVGWRGEILAEAERAAVMAETSRVFETVMILRCAGIYGPGRTRLIDSVRSGDPGDSSRMTNRIHRDDAARAVVHLLGVDDVELPDGRVFLGVDDEPVDDWTVRAWLADRLGAKPPVRQPSAAPGSWSGKRCSNARLRALGWRPDHPTFREGYTTLLASG